MRCTPDDLEKLLWAPIAAAAAVKYDAVCRCASPSALRWLFSISVVTPSPSPSSALILLRRLDHVWLAHSEARHA